MFSAWPADAASVSSPSGAMQAELLWSAPGSCRHSTARGKGLEMAEVRVLSFTRRRCWEPVERKRTRLQRREDAGLWKQEGQLARLHNLHMLCRGSDGVCDCFGDSRSINKL